jgi:hypothetical protein
VKKKEKKYRVHFSPDLTSSRKHCRENPREWKLGKGTSEFVDTLWDDHQTFQDSGQILNRLKRLQKNKNKKLRMSTNVQQSSSGVAINLCIIIAVSLHIQTIHERVHKISGSCVDPLPRIL